MSLLHFFSFDSQVKEDAEDISREVCILGMLKGQEGIVQLHDVFEDEKVR